VAVAWLSLDGHRSKTLSEYMGLVHFGYMITVCADAEERYPSVFPGMGQRLHRGVRIRPPVPELKMRP
jgi:hypothetical protein